MASQSFTSAGADTFEVPEGVSSLTVKIWPGGGGGGGGGSASVGGDGAGGGYVQGTIVVTELETLAIHVGGAAGGGSSPTNSGSGGGGGGRSSIFRNSTPLLIAGGGGGGGGGDNSSATPGGDGGEGGANTGEAGGESDGAFGGGGGTQTVGGAAGTGGGNSGVTGEAYNGSPAGGGGDGANGVDSESTKGSQANGGTTNGGDGGTGNVSAGFAGGGGGGSGYAGGGGGSGSVTGNAGGGGGGGGSNYLVGSATSTTNSQAVDQTPPNTGDPYYQENVGEGGDGGGTGNSGSNGNDGLVVLIWVEPFAEFGLEFVMANSQYLASVSSFTPPADATVCFWMRLKTVDNLRIMGNDDFWEIGLFDDGRLFNDLNQSGDNFSSVEILLANRWYHITCTRNSSDVATIYINGAFDSTDLNASGSPGSDILRIGHRTGATEEEYFNGLLEDMRIYNRVLSAAEIATIYAQRGSDNILYGLLNRWVMNELPIDTVVPPGITNFGWDSAGGSSSTVASTRIMGGDFPDLSTVVRLKSVSIYVGSQHSAQARLGVYQGGTTTLPNGASLLEDLGQTIGSATSQWLTILSATNSIITPDTPTWVAAKRGSTFTAHYSGSAVGDWYTAHGRTDVPAMGSDPTVSFPSTVPSGGSNSGSWYSWYLTYYGINGVVKDWGPNKLNMSGYNEPIYRGTRLKFGHRRH